MAFELRNLYKHLQVKLVMIFKKIRDVLSNEPESFEKDDYIEVDLGQEQKENKILVKLFVLKEYEDVNQILNALREGYTIAIIDTKTLRQRDLTEFKRAISKIKKTTDALEGSIKAFREIVIVAPSFASIQEGAEPIKDNVSQKETDSKQ